MALTICSINVNGIAEHAKRQKVFLALCNSPFDIYLIQETHLPDLNQGVIWEQQWGGRALWSPGTNCSAGVGILFHPRCTVEITDSKLDSEGRVLAVKLKSATSTFQVVNIYAPNKQAERAHCVSHCFATQTTLLSTTAGYLFPFPSKEELGRVAPFHPCYTVSWSKH